MSKLDKQKFYLPLRKKLTEQFGTAEGDAVWRDAGEIYDKILAETPGLGKHKGAMVIPSAL